MITIILLIIIYMAFISLGLPDSILGVSWPEMSLEFGMALDQIGYVSIIITISTVLSSLLSGYLIDRFGTGKVTVASVFLTAIAILGISIIPSFYWLMLLALPLGFGAGSIDTALNNYVALNYKAHHMNWLHSFWGFGATLGPIIMAYTLASAGWRQGFKSIGLIQVTFFIILLFTLPLWKKTKNVKSKEVEKQLPKKPKNLYKKKGVLTAISIFMIYCALEFSVGLWGSSYLVHIRNFSSEDAAKVIAFYYGGIMIGRFISGFVSFKLTNKQMIYLGMLIVFIGTLLLNIPLNTNLTFIPYIVIGLGLSPIFPAMIHETPRSFGKEYSQYIIGYQMAGAYLGGSVFPPLFGIIANQTSLILFPYYLLGLGILLLILINTLFIQVKQLNT